VRKLTPQRLSSFLVTIKALYALLCSRATCRLRSYYWIIVDI